MIVVEGPDGSGKTTLIKKLSEHTNFPVAPRVVSKDAEAMVDLKQWVEDNLAGGWQPTIFDRHRLISEPIYGPLLRSKPEPGFDDNDWFYGHLATFYDLDPIIIYCLPPYEVVKANVKADPENWLFQDEAVLRPLWGAYFNKAHTEQALRAHANTWLYDYTDKGTAELIFNYLVHRITSYKEKLKCT